MNYPLFSSESVCAGHPDKLCDQVSDAVLDAVIKINPLSRVACETLATTNRLILAGEITCPQKPDYEKIARDVIKDLGYSDPVLNFGPQTEVEVFLHSQSLDIATGVDKGGAGDQGMMFGYATKETAQLMPLPITLAHELCRAMDQLAKNELPYLRPDGKSQVTVKYDERGVPVSVERVVLAKPHDPGQNTDEILNQLYQLAVLPMMEKYRMPKIDISKIIFNGTGSWEIGGPATDAGVTGRKIVVDTYGGMGRIGGGCFSGKDPTKVDRSGAYAARFIAKNVVAAGLADRCEVQLAYAIGYRDPVGKAIETFGTAKKDQKIIEDFAWGLIGLSVGEIIETLKLRRPIFRETARYGHFGYAQYPWEQIV